MAWVVTFWYQFAGDATVEGDGKEHHGIEAIRAWRSEVPRVTYPVHEVRRNDGGYDAATDIADGFAGSPVRFTFHFEFTANDRIHLLTIRP
jgi:hypothetical protein